MYTLPFGGLASTVTIAMAAAGGAYVLAKKLLTKFKASSAVQVMGSVPPNKALQATMGAGTAGLALMKGLPKKREWWKDLGSQAGRAIKSLRNRFRLRKKQEGQE